MPRMKFSVNVSADVGEKVRAVAYEEAVSRSCIIDVALQELFRAIPPEGRARFLRENGACLRRD